MAEMPVIDREKCTGCGLCVSVCACGALVLVDDKATVVKREGCNICTRWCTLCESVCYYFPYHDVLHETKVAYRSYLTA